MLLITIFTTVFFVFIDNQHIDILYFEKEALKSNSNNQNPVNRKRYRYSHAESEVEINIINFTILIFENLFVYFLN